MLTNQFRSGLGKLVLLFSPSVAGGSSKFDVDFHILKMFRHSLIAYDGESRRFQIVLKFGTAQLLDQSETPVTNGDN